MNVCPVLTPFIQPTAPISVLRLMTTRTWDPLRSTALGRFITALAKALRRTSSASFARSRAVDLLRGSSRPIGFA